MVSAKKLGILIFLTMLLSITVALPVRAQTPTLPTPRDVLLGAITEQAQRDEQKMVRESTEGLNLLFGEQAKQVGRPLSEVVKIDANAYPAAKLQRLAENPMHQFVRHLPNAPEPIQRARRSWLSSFLFR